MPGITPVNIYGKTYNLKSGTTNVDPEQLAAFVDSKMHELSTAKTTHSTTDLAVLAALNIAGELMEIQGKYQAETDAVQKKAESLIRKLTHELEDFEL